MQFPSMIVFLVWVMVRKIEWMPQVRASLCLATFSGLIIHLLFPLMPPRLMVSYGFIDTAKVFGPDPYSLGIAKAANEFAAMPSLHVGWALLIALAAIRILKTPARWLMLLHPILTTIVVVITANHFWLDIIVGAILALAGWQLATKYWPIQTIKKMKDQFFMSEEDRKVAEEKLEELKRPLNPHLMVGRTKKVRYSICSSVQEFNGVIQVTSDDVSAFLHSATTNSPISSKSATFTSLPAFSRSDLTLQRT